MQYEAKELEFYKSTAWTKLSKSFRLRFPVCKSCFQRGIIRKAELVDHIQPVKTPYGWEHRLDEANLQSLCLACHNAKTAREVAQRHSQRPSD
jgi:5-methylcytosine-specific restriction endonuclease McrA